MDTPDIQTEPSIHTPVKSLEGSTVLVCGGTTGIGRATAVLLGSYGARLMIFGRHEAELQSALADIRKTGAEAHGVLADQAVAQDVRNVFQAFDEKFERLDVLINSAAVVGARLTESSIEELTYEINVNYTGYVACTREGVERMKRHGAGHIVNIGSMSADLREKGGTLYASTKAAIQAFSESLRKEVNPAGIKVTLIEPGAVGTDLQGASPPEQRKQSEEGTLLKAEDIAVSVHYCLTQPDRCHVVLIQLRPQLQLI